MFDPIDYVRMFNAALTLSTLVYAWKLRRNFAARPVHDRFFALAGLGCSVILGFGAIEAIISNVPGGARVACDAVPRVDARFSCDDSWKGT